MSLPCIFLFFFFGRVGYICTKVSKFSLIVRRVSLGF